MPGFGFGSRARMRRSIVVGLPGPSPAPTPAPTPAFAAATAPSIAFGQRNGDSAGTGIAQRWLGGPILLNVFGDRNNANTSGGRLPGLLAIRVAHRPGNAVSTGTSTSALNQSQMVMGSGASTATRNLRLQWWGAQSTNTAFQDRFQWAGAFANGAFLGDVDPVTGATGSASSARGLRSAPVDQYRTEPVMLFLRMNAAGRLQVYHAYADGVLVAGDFIDHPADAGFANGNTNMAFGRAGTSALYNNSWSGSIRDFVQVNNRDVTDAEMMALARGEDPATLFGSELYAHYRMGGASDVAKTAGSSAYAALTVNDANAQLRDGAALAPAVAGTRGIQLLPEFDGFVHALSPTAVRGAANRAAVKALTGATLMRVRVVGAGTTHVWGRIRRASDDVVLVNWTKMTTSAVGAGEHEQELPGCPVGVDYYREVGAEDALCVSQDRQRHRMGIVAAMVGQSQQQRLWSEAAAGADTASGNGDVSYMHCYGVQTGGFFLSAVAGQRIDRPGQIGPALYELAKHWQAHNDGIALMLVSVVRAGTGRDSWMTRANSNQWADSSTPAGGHIPATIHAARGRFTLWLENWHTTDQGAINAGSLPALSDELYLGIGSSAGRSNFAQFGLKHPIWVSGVPFIRHRIATAPVPSEGTRADYETARAAMRTYYGGTGGSASLLRDIGAYMTALAMGPIADGPHCRADDVRGNVYMARWSAMALARACKLYAVDIETTFTAATRAGAVITVASNRPNGGSLQTMVDDQTPVGFEVSEDGGTSWSRSSGAVPFTVARVGNAVTLTKGSNWAAGTQVRYLFGYPWDIPPGNDATAFAAETAAVNQMLAETVAAAPMGRVPLRPTLGALVAA